jgi:signal transduction histidine kinase/DNA-binding response OmpR family regulator
LLQSFGWIFLALAGVIPEVISELGSPLIMLAMALYYHALLDFKGGSTKRIYWVYILVVLHLFALYYFVLITSDIAARIVVASITAAILMFACAYILFVNKLGKLPNSHIITGSLFAICSAVLVSRAIYYLVWNTAPHQSTLDQNIMQDIAFLTFFIAAVLSPFTFMLMCNDRYTENALLRTAELASKNIDLEIANEAKGQFLATMSHELRTPLNGVIGFLNQLNKTSLNSLQQDYLHTIDLSARTLLSVINDILDFSKIEAGKLTLENINIDLRALLDDQISIFLIAAKEKGLGLSSEVDITVPLFLVADPLRLSQILNNLMANAIKFTEQGFVKITVNLVSESEREVSLNIIVSDSGIGIPAESIDKLFKPFVQADASTTRKHGGTGLGLVIARRLVEMMGGVLTVASKVSEGTQFSFNVRLLKADTRSSQILQNAGSYQVGRPQPLLGKRVLVVDDNNINRKLAQLLVTEMGGVFDSAENGIQVIDAISRKAYDLILMDINMPVMDGLEATRRIRALESGTRRTPIIALTANALPGDKEKFIDAGMDEYLSKPIHEHTLMNMLYKIFPGNESVQIDTGSAYSNKNKDLQVVSATEMSVSNLVPALDPRLGIELSFDDVNAWNMALNMLLDGLSDFATQLEENRNDLESLTFIAHKLAGSSCYCGTTAIYEAAKKLESDCRLGELLLVDKSLSLVQQQIVRLLELDAAHLLRSSNIVVY